MALEHAQRLRRVIASDEEPLRAGFNGEHIVQHVRAGAPPLPARASIGVRALHYDLVLDHAARAHKLDAVGAGAVEVATPRETEHVAGVNGERIPRAIGCRHAAYDALAVARARSGAAQSHHRVVVRPVLAHAGAELGIGVDLGVIVAETRDRSPVQALDAVASRHDRVRDDVYVPVGEVGAARHGDLDELLLGVVVGHAVPGVVADVHLVDPRALGRDGVQNGVAGEALASVHLVEVPDAPVPVGHGPVQAVKAVAMLVAVLVLEFAPQIVLPHVLRVEGAWRVGRGYDAVGGIVGGTERERAGNAVEAHRSHMVAPVRIAPGRDAALERRVHNKTRVIQLVAHLLRLDCALEAPALAEKRLLAEVGDVRHHLGGDVH